MCAAKAKKLDIEAERMVRSLTMGPGANGSAATHPSTHAKVTNKVTADARAATTIGEVREMLLAMSRPRSKLRTASTRTKAPRKSTRIRRVLNGVVLVGVDGRFKKAPTARHAKAVPGTWTRNDQRHPTVSAINPPGCC